MNILLIGSGAREHAIATALKRSREHPAIFCYATSCHPALKKITAETNGVFFQGKLADVNHIINIATQHQIDLAIIGPEAPLEQGLADKLWQHQIPTIGPKQALAKIETSKAFARMILEKYHIPGSIRYQRFGSLMGVEDFLHELGDQNYVIKADGLMGGKGVKVAGDHLHSIAEALTFCKELHAAGCAFVIEEKCIGQEFSLLCFSDGKTVIPMPLVQDHKRAFINDQGPNTGGMGSYSDADHNLPFLTADDAKLALEINTQVIAALKTECQENYIGILYGSFMATKDGLKVIEFNARFGDPEAMNVLAVLETDFVKICQAMVTQTLTADLVRFAKLATVCKYVVPEGYPDDPVKNSVINLANVKHPERLYLAAVDSREDKLYATGSRAVAVLGIAETIFDAEQLAEQEMQFIQGTLFHRADIGTRELIQRRIEFMRKLRGS